MSEIEMNVSAIVAAEVQDPRRLLFVEDHFDGDGQLWLHLEVHRAAGNDSSAAGYLTVRQVKTLRKHLKRVLRKAGEL